MITKLLYLDNMPLLEATANVVSVSHGENGKQIINLDQTIFYAQGGGQPFDTGKIETSKGVFKVQEVRKKDGVVNHVGVFESGNFEIGDEVNLFVDAERRALNSKLHSAGHVIDVAMKNVGLDFIPGKGYHFPDGPYVEYDGEVLPEQREEYGQKLETEANRLIQLGSEVKVQTVSFSEVKLLCGFVPSYLSPVDGAIRIVTVAGEFGCPCGGTHVKNISEISSVKIPKISAKSGKTRVSYLLG
ncbi:MAG: alanine--tRNA ligase-related protein [Candidatus Micrarchaeota archaeon]|nr:alanine--tRNA ligase-related protein [Candidatus Micrarchaeota archaeon]